jgi:hypothetical protein
MLEAGRRQMTIMAHVQFILNTYTKNKVSEYAIRIVFPCNNGCKNAPKCYVKCAQHLLFQNKAVSLKPSPQLRMLC